MPGVHIATTVPDGGSVARRVSCSRGSSASATTPASRSRRKHDPFLPLALASQTTSTLRLGTAVAIGFARNPMVLANVGYDLQQMSGGRFVLGLGSQVRPHIRNRFSEEWSRPAARMRELVLAVRAIWDCWEGRSELRFEGEFYRHTLMTPAFDPGPNPFGPPPVFVGRLRSANDRGRGRGRRRAHRASVQLAPLAGGARAARARARPRASGPTRARRSRSCG